MSACSRGINAGSTPPNPKSPSAAYFGAFVCAVALTTAALFTGAATHGEGGDILVSVGKSKTDTGGDVYAIAGDSTPFTGGAVSLTTGEGTDTSSGSFIVRTVNAGTTGVSGKLSFTSGTTSSGNGSARRSDRRWLR